MEGSAPVPIDIDVKGTQEADYNLSVEPAVDWASVSPAEDQTPGAATLTLNGKILGSGLGTTQLVVRAEVAGIQASDRIDISLLSRGVDSQPSNAPALATVASVANRH